MPVGMPSYTDYDQMLGMNPWAQMQANEQLGLANQFQQQDLQKGQLANEKSGLDNLFQQQNDPTKLRRGQLENTGLDQTNQSGALDLERKQANHQNMLSADQRKAVLTASEDEIKQLDYHVGLLLRDPATHQEGLKLQQLMPEILAEKRKQADLMEKERYTQMQQTGRALEQQQSAERIAGMNIAGRQAVAGAKGSGTPADFWTTFNTKLKNARDKHAALIAEATRIGVETPEGAQMLAIAESIRPQAEAEIATTKPGGINTGAVAGLPTNAGPQIAPGKPKAPAGIPAGAKQIGTSGGKPVYQLPDGRKVIAE